LLRRTVRPGDRVLCKASRRVALDRSSIAWSPNSAAVGAARRAMGGARLTAMIHWLAPWLFSDDVCRLLGYISFRAAGAAVTAFLLAILFGPRVIALAAQLGVGERIDGTGSAEARGAARHKRGTPTMGGLFVIGAHPVLVQCAVAALRRAQPVLVAGIVLSPDSRRSASGTTGSSCTTARSAASASARSRVR
jgi:hypothetical protein